MSDYLTDLKVCHVGLFVCLEPADRHGGCEGPDDGPGNGPGQLWAVWPDYLVGGHLQLGGWCHPAAGEGHLDGTPPFEEVGAVSDRHVSRFLPSYSMCHKWSYLVS
jgi:hypothetical protein